MFAVCASALYLAIYFAMKGPPLAWFQYVLWIEQPLLYNLAAAGGKLYFSDFSPASWRPSQA